MAPSVRSTFPAVRSRRRREQRACSTSGTAPAPRRGSWAIGWVAFGNGHLYVADTWSSSVRKIDVKTGQVVSLFGPGYQGSEFVVRHWDVEGPLETASISVPHGLLWTPQGLFVSNYWNI